MPESLGNLSPAALAGVLVAYLLAASRVAGPLKPLLAKLPEPWARIAPAIVALLPQVADLFTDVNTWLSFLVSASNAAALVLPGFMKDPPAPPPPGDSKPVAAKPSEPHVFLQNEDGSPIEMRAYGIARRSPSRSAGGLYEFVSAQLRRAGVVVLPVPRSGVLVLLACLVLPGCASLASVKLPCNDANLRAIDRAYIAEVGSTCLAKYSSAAACPEYKRIKAKHRAALRNECPQ